MSVSAANVQFTATPDTSMIRDSLRFEVVDSTGGNTGAVEVRAFGPPA